MRDDPRRTAAGSASPTRLEPVPGEPAATAAIGSERALLVADYHAGYESGLRYERGVDVPSRAPDRRERLAALLERTDPDRLVVLGDLMHSIGDPGGAERGELEVLFESFASDLAVTVVKGNHDGRIETWLAESDAVEATVDVVPGGGVALGDVGVCHGHTCPRGPPSRATSSVWATNTPACDSRTRSAAAASNVRGFEGDSIRPRSVTGPNTRAFRGSSVPTNRPRRRSSCRRSTTSSGGPGSTCPDSRFSPRFFRRDLQTARPICWTERGSVPTSSSERVRSDWSPVGRPVQATVFVTLFAAVPPRSDQKRFNCITIIGR